MRIALLQYPIVWADKTANLQAATTHLRAIKGKADVAVMAEMFSTGFCTNRPDLAEPIDGPTMQELQKTADDCELAIVGSFICKEKEHLYNRGFFLTPHQQPQFVDKAHLYAHGGEAQFFTRGRQRSVFTYQGVRFRLILCYDLRFPAWIRNKDNAYDILLVSANWPEIRIAYWDALIAARATENQCYIVGVNPVGDDGLGLHYNGHSIAYDTHLDAIAQFEDNEEGTHIADFDMEQLQHYRTVLPLWKDADKFTLED